MKSIWMRALVVAAVLSACAKKASDEFPSLDEKLQIARNAVGLVGNEMVWSCSGKKAGSADEFVTATLQRDPKTGQCTLMASEITVQGRGYSQRGIFIQPVTVRKSIEDERLETYYLPGVDARIFTDKPYASYHSVKDVAAIGEARGFWSSIEIDCEKARYKITGSGISD